MYLKCYDLDLSNLSGRLKARPIIRKQMVTKLRKQETLNELKDKFSKSTAIYTTDQVGLTVSEITELRAKLRDVDAEYKIAKNTLMNLAAAGSDYESLTKDLEGPTALVFCYGDATAPAGVVKKYTKEVPDKISFKAGFLEGEFIEQEKVLQVASLPSKEVLLSQIAGLLTSAISSTAYIVGELGSKEGEDKLLKDFIVKDEAEAPKEEAKAEEPKAEEAKAEEAKEESKEESKEEEKGNE